MLIHVIYKNDKHDFIKDARLDEFIKTGKVLMFQRGDEWVRVGVDPTRVNPPDFTYSGIERRQKSEE